MKTSFSCTANLERLIKFHSHKILNKSNLIQIQSNCAGGWKYNLNLISIYFWSLCINFNFIFIPSICLFKDFFPDLFKQLKISQTLAWEWNIVLLIKFISLFSKVLFFQSVLTDNLSFMKHTFKIKKKYFF